jgi:hypothetical protein
MPSENTMQTSLKSLYETHTGKVSDKWSTYLGIYSDFFSPVRNNDVGILEIGIQNGGSLEIWDKFFPNAKFIIGVDIDEKCKLLTFESPKISVIVGDANSDAVVNALAARKNEFDIIIDDGSHTSGDIVKTFCKYFPMLKHNGIFIAEDLHCSYWERFNGGLYYPFSSIGFFKSLVDIINHEHWGIEKSRETYLSEIASAYGVSMSEDALSDILSVVFFNSMCVVTKRAEDDLATVGTRFTAGTEARVGPPGNHGRAFPEEMKGLLAQEANPFSISASEGSLELEKINARLLEEMSKLKDNLKKTNEKLIGTTNALNNVLNSTSWKITQPVRTIKQLVTKK